MISKKSTQDIKQIAKSCAICSFALKQVVKNLKPSITTLELDMIARRTIEARGAMGSFLDYRGYKYTTCISINDEVVHGLPSSRALKNGDLVGVDLGVNYNDFFSDMAVTCSVGEANHETRRLLKGTKEALEEAIKIIRPGIRVGEVEHKTGSILKKYGLSPITALSGHGVGYAVHEEPSIKSDGQPTRGEIIGEGMVLAIEPMAALGKADVITGSDGWTVKTRDGSATAHFEHTIVVTRTGSRILTR